MSLRPRVLPVGFIGAVTFAPQPPSRLPVTPDCMKSGTTAIRVIARKNGNRVRLYSRPGNDLTQRFPLIVEALGALRSRSCIIDAEAVACGDDGIACFELIRRFWDAYEQMQAWCEGQEHEGCTRLEAM
jgi:hypothetical protein